MEGGLDLHQVKQSQLVSGWTSKLFDGEGAHVGRCRLGQPGGQWNIQIVWRKTKQTDLVHNGWLDCVGG